MEELEKTRKIVKTSFFIAVVTVAVLLVFPYDMKPKEWQIYANSYFITTLGLTAGGAAIGILLGMLLAFLKFQKTNIEVLDMIKDVIIDEYVDIMRGTPMVLQLLTLSFVVVIFNNYWIALIALGLNSAAYVEETIRSGIESIDKGQMEAARATGMPYRMAMNEIVMPQAIKNILPALLNEFINLFKETAVVGYISVVDITMNSKSLQAVYYSVKPILFTGLVYYISVKLFSFIGKRLEMKLKEND